MGKLYEAVRDRWRRNPLIAVILPVIFCALPAHLEAQGEETSDYQLPELIGFISNNTKIEAGEAEPGLYRIPLNGEESAEPIVTDADRIPRHFAGSGVIIGNKYFLGYNDPDEISYLKEYGYFEIDLQTAKILRHWYVDGYTVCTDMAYDELTGKTYGVDIYYQGHYLETIDFPSPRAPESTMVRRKWLWWDALSIDRSGQLYAIINFNSDPYSSEKYTKLLKVDKLTGEDTTVGTPSEIIQVRTACFDFRTNKMICVVYKNSKNSIYLLDVDTLEATKLYDLKDNDTVWGLCVAVPPIPDGAPGECPTESEISIAPGSLTGAITVTAPSSLSDGSAGEGALELYIEANHQVVGHAAAGWGETVTIPLDFTTAGPGWYNFRVYGKNAAGSGKQTLLAEKVFVGCDTPVVRNARLTCTAGKMIVEWNPATAKSGGYIVPEEVTYTIRDREGNIKAEGVTGLSWSETVDPSLPDAPYRYEVSAEFNGYKSASVQTNEATGNAMMPPYAPNFEAMPNGSMPEGWAVLDYRGFREKWHVREGKLHVESEEIMDPPAHSIGADDWAITPPLYLEKDRRYTLSFTYRSYRGFQILLGRGPTREAMPENIYSADGDAWSDNPGKHESIEITVPESGVYHIGFHAAHPESIETDIWDLKIEPELAAGVPDAGVLEAATDENDPHKTYLTATFPTVDIDGNELTEITRAEMMRGCVPVATIENPEPGAAVRLEDITNYEGTTYYSLICYNENGPGRTASAATQINYAMPMPINAVRTEQLDEDGLVSVSWDPVTHDINGYQYPENAVAYDITFYRRALSTTGWCEMEKIEGLKETSRTFQSVTPGMQGVVKWKVTPSYNGKKGISKECDEFFAGRPYELIDEDFASYPSESTRCAWLFAKRPNVINKWALYYDSRYNYTHNKEDESDRLVRFGSSNPDAAMLISGIIGMKEDCENPILTFHILNIPTSLPNRSQVNVYVHEVDNPDSGWTQVFSSTVNEICGAKNPETDPGRSGMSKASVDLSGYRGKLIQFGIETVISGKNVNVLLDDITLNAIEGYDLYPVSLTADAKANTATSDGGCEDVLTAVIANLGPHTAYDVQVILYRDGHLSPYRETLSRLEPNKTATVEFRNPCGNQDGDLHEFYVRVASNEDYCPDNDISESVWISSQQGYVGAIEADSVRIYAAEGRVMVAGAEGLTVTVVTADGRLIWSGEGAELTEIPTGTGIFIVRAGSEVRKLLVR